MKKRNRKRPGAAVKYASWLARNVSSRPRRQNRPVSQDGAAIAFTSTNICMCLAWRPQTFTMQESVGRTGRGGLRSTSWRPAGRRDVTELPALRRIHPSAFRFSRRHCRYDSIIIGSHPRSYRGRAIRSRPAPGAGRAAKHRPYRTDPEKHAKHVRTSSFVAPPS